MLASVEASEENFSFVHFRVKFQVAVHIGEDDEVGRLGNDDLVIKYSDAEWAVKVWVLEKYFRAVSLSITVGVFEDHDTITSWAATLLSSVVNSLQSPDAAVLVNIHVGRVIEHGRCGPDGDF